MVRVEDYEENAEKAWWCPGCGDYAVIKALREALVALQIEPKDLAIVAGIGCSGKAYEYINGYAIHGVHGRVLPLATGVRLANTKLKVLALGGDGDAYAIGLGHLPHAIRRNLDITYIVMDNQTYGLTKGQASPTSEFQYKSTTTPSGSIESAINPMTLALASGATFLARAFSGNPKHMAKVFERGLAHKGFSLIDVFSPCVTYNKVNTYDWFRKHIHYVDEEPGYDSADFEAAWRIVQPGDRLAVGVIYQTEKPTFEELMPGADSLPIAKAPIEGADYSELIEEFF